MLLKRSVSMALLGLLLTALVLSACGKETPPGPSAATTQTALTSGVGNTTATAFAVGTAVTSTVTTVPYTAQPTVQLTTQEAAQPTVRPTTQGATQPTVRPTTQGLTQPTTQMVTQPATQGATQPTVKPTKRPTTAPTVPTTKPTTKPTVQPVLPPPELPAIDSRIQVEASGVKVAQGGGARIDYSNIKDGYVMVRYDTATPLRLKVQVKGPSTTYTYNLTPEKWTAFPLSDQNGEYRVTVCQNVGGTKYAVVLSTGFQAQMTDEFAPFLRSNQYVDILSAPNTAAKAQQLVAGKTDPLKKVEAVYDFVVNTLSYDRELAATVQSGYLPVLDQVLAKKKGICFDYAALMTGMLRSQGVPTKLVVGYAGQAYHAWISVYTEDTGWIDGVIYFDGASWHRMDPTYASSGGGSQDILDYIGDGTNYTAKYFY